MRSAEDLLDALSGCAVKVNGQPGTSGKTVISSGAGRSPVTATASMVPLRAPNGQRKLAPVVMTPSVPSTPLDSERQVRHSSARQGQGARENFAKSESPEGNSVVTGHAERVEGRARQGKENQNLEPTILDPVPWKHQGRSGGHLRATSRASIVVVIEDADPSEPWMQAECCHSSPLWWIGGIALLAAFSLAVLSMVVHAPAP